jgi:hypothetical protein
MGLSICAKLKFGSPDKETTPEDALSAVQQLHQEAFRLPFKSISPALAHVQGLEFYTYLSNEPAMSFLSDLLIEVHTDNNTTIKIAPMIAVFFGVWPGEWCAPTMFGLAKYPDKIPLPFADRVLSAKYPGTWMWRTACKTQYASNVSEQHFLSCHTSLCKLLDKAKSLGFDVIVHDDGGYWESRDTQKLTQELAKRNEEAAIATRVLTDIFGPDNIQHPIQDNIAYITANASR